MKKSIILVFAFMIASCAGSVKKDNNENQQTKLTPIVESLSVIRGALQVYYADNEAKYPDDLKKLIPNYLKEIPQTYLNTEHCKSSSNIIYYKGNIYDHEGKIIAEKLKDTDGWGYVYDETSGYNGSIFINCKGKTSKGYFYFEL